MDWSFVLRKPAAAHGSACPAHAPSSYQHADACKPGGLQQAGSERDLLALALCGILRGFLPAPRFSHLSLTRIMQMTVLLIGGVTRDNLLLQTLFPYGLLSRQNSELTAPHGIPATSCPAFTYFGCLTFFRMARCSETTRLLLLFLQAPCLFSVRVSFRAALKKICLSGLPGWDWTA